MLPPFVSRSAPGLPGSESADHAGLPWAFGPSQRRSFLAHCLVLSKIHSTSTFSFENGKFIKVREVVNARVKIVQYSYKDS